MNKILAKTSALLAVTALSFSSAVFAGDQYEVTITNLTRAQAFTPILVASHKQGVELFKLGAPASSELAALAEGGDVAPLTAVLNADKRVKGTSHSAGLTMPGASTTLVVSADDANRISLAAMLIPTNDAFIALNGIKVKGKKSMTVYSPAYDAGSEINDELCVSIPGPVCGGEGGSPNAGGEGYVHVHGGIHGIGDLPAATYDWRNPVAKITIRKMD